MLKDLPESESEGWKTIDESVQVRRVGVDLFMMRQGADGTAVAITTAKLEQYLARLTKNRQN
ncbi:MAG: hypothetical protein IT381_16235 [Deltaproteobacteria bacterium]|nr:hypothetical protein [Deltaproteobacteria bacterium]